MEMIQKTLPGHGLPQQSNNVDPIKNHLDKNQKEQEKNNFQLLKQYFKGRNLIREYHENLIDISRCTNEINKIRARMMDATHEETNKKRELTSTSQELKKQNKKLHFLFQNSPTLDQIIKSHVDDVKTAADILNSWTHLDDDTKSYLLAKLISNNGLDKMSSLFYYLKDHRGKIDEKENGKIAQKIAESENPAKCCEALNQLFRLKKDESNVVIIDNTIGKKDTEELLEFVEKLSGDDTLMEILENSDSDESGWFLAALKRLMAKYI